MTREWSTGLEAIDAISTLTGINDGSTTEITGKTITEGMKVIAGTITPAATTAQTSTAPATPFQGSSQQQGGAQRGGGLRGGF